MVLAQTAILTRLSYGTRLQKLYHSSRQTTYQLHFRATARRLTYQLHSRAIARRLTYCTSSQRVPTNMRQLNLFNVRLFMLFSRKIVPMLWKIMLLMRKLVLMP